MRIKKFETNGFGCLKGSYEFGPLPATLIIEKNEKGKSTFVSGILAALYGLDENGLHGLQEKERFRPMKSEEFDVALLVQIGEREYRIVRDFNAGSVGIWNEKTGQEITSEFTMDDGQVRIGEGLIDLSRNGFLKTALIRQQEIQSLREPSHIAEKIEGMFDTLSGNATARKAVALLTEARDRYRGNSSLETEIDRLRAQLRNYQDEWDGLKRKREVLDEKVARLLGLGRQWNDLRASLDRAEYIRFVSRKEVLEERVTQYEERKRYLRELESELPSLGDIASFPADRETDLMDAIQALALIDNRIDTLKADCEGVRKRIEATDMRISQEFEPIESLTEAACSEISHLMKTLQKDLSTLPDIRGAYETEKNLVVQEGFRLKDYADLKKTVGKITAEEKPDVLRYPESSGTKKNEIRTLKKEIRTREVKAEETENELKRKRKSRNRALIVGGSLVLLAAGTYALTRSPYHGIVVGLPVDWLAAQATCGALGLFAVLWGLMRGWRGGKEEIRVLSDDKRRLEALHVKKDRMEKQLEREGTRMEKLVHRSGLRSPEELCERLKQFDRLEERTDRLRTLGARLSEAKSRVLENRSKLAAYLEEVGEDPEEKSWAAMVRFYKKVEAYPRVQSEKRDAEERLKNLEEQIQATNREKKEKSELIASILNESQIIWDGDGDRVIEEFREKLQKSRRFVEIRDELLPQARLDQIPDETYESILSALQGVEGAMGDIEQRCSEVKRDASQAHAMPDDAVEQRKAEMERVSEEGQGLRNEITQFLRCYPRDSAKLQEEMERCRKELEEIELFERAAKLAIQYLESIRRELHHRCAEFMNQKANTVLSHLAPICESIEIKPDFSFSLNHRELRTRLDQAHVDGLLSVGVRDQIYLALRLAISQYLSASGIHLPFILDDPLITSDDDRFVDTMNFVTKELTENHQIVILTCHEKRHQWWLDHIPKGHRNRVQISRLE